MEKTNPTNLDDVRQQAEFDKQMSLARVSRMRGDYAQAAEAVRLALRVKPENPEAMEFAADVLAARGELAKAAEIYKNLHEADASRVSAEEKFARITIQIAEGKRQQDLLKYMAENPGKYQPKGYIPNPLIAAVLSLVPGLGQMYCRKFAKGVAIFVAVMVCWLFIGLLGVDWRMAVQSSGQFLKQIDPLAIIILCFSISLHVYAFVDAPVYANKLKDELISNPTEPKAP